MEAPSSHLAFQVRLFISIHILRGLEIINGPTLHNLSCSKPLNIILYKLSMVGLSVTPILRRLKQEDTTISQGYTRLVSEQTEQEPWRIAPRH